MKMKNKICIVMSCVAIAGITLPASAQWGKEAKVAETPKTSEDNLKDRISLMQQNIEKATAQFKRVADSSAEAKMAELDNMIGQIDSAIKELSSSGELNKELQRAIQNSEEKLKKAKSKYLDPSIPAKKRARYQTFINSADDQVNKLSEGMMSLESARRELESKKSDLEEDKEFFAFAMEMDDLEAANESLQSVIQSVLAVNETISEMSEKLGVDSGESGPQ
jgi:DNA repair exonuclease SbcCD ATPase subunit